MPSPGRWWRMTDTAIVGLDCVLNGLGLEAFARVIYAGETPATSVDDALSLEALAIRLVGRILDHRTMQVSIGVIVCAETDATEKAERLVADLSPRSSGSPGLGMGAGNLAAALEMGRKWLTGDPAPGARGVDLVLIAAAEQLGIGALLLARRAAIQRGMAYALISGVAQGKVEDNAAICRSALAQADVGPGDVGYLQVDSWPLGQGVIDGYRLAPPAGADAMLSVGDTDTLSCAVGSPAAGFCRSPLAALFAAVLALHRRTLFTPAIQASPAVSKQEADLTNIWADTPFFLPLRSCPWFPSPEVGRRIAAVAYGMGDQAGHLVLTEAGPQREGPAVHARLREVPSYLLPILARDRAEMLARLEWLRQRLQSGAVLSGLAEELYAIWAAEGDAAYATALVVHTREEALKEVALALEGVARAFEKGGAWLTPRGSSFTAAPLQGGVAFVYPGASNSYVGLGADLFQHFPGLHEHLAELTSDPSRTLAARWLYPRSRSLGRKKDAVARRQAALFANPIALIESGASFAIAHTVILRDIFGVQPQLALGYSLGEVSMLWAAGVWQDADTSSDKLRASPLFRERVAGPQLAIREHWALDREAEITWQTHLLKADVTDVQVLVAQEPRVYLTLINLQNEVVIAGEASGCRRVIEALGCHALPVPFDIAIHNDAIRSEYKAFEALYTNPVVKRPDTVFYSAADYAPLVLESAALGRAMARMSCQLVDFPKLVGRAYEHGDAAARIFVELGPLATCTRRIQRILHDRAHTAIAMNPSVQAGSDFDGVLGVLAQLIAHRVPMDLSPLRASVEARKEQTGLVISARHPENRETPDTVPVSLRAYADRLLPLSSRRADLHRAFLERRADAQARAASVIGLQIALGRQVVGGPEPSDDDAGRPPHHPQASQPVQFTERHLEAFATGDVTECFGPDYAIYRNRRVSRIPNGALLLMSRVRHIEGQPGDFDAQPRLWSEFDVPTDAWFYSGGLYPGLPPYMVLMEMALQPCGFLSAYLRSSLIRPEADLYFRNLDGHGSVTNDLDLRGRRVVNEVKLISSVRGQGVILQTFTFAMECEGAPIYRGGASFGFFPKQSLARQAGLDGEMVTDLRKAAKPSDANATCLPIHEPLPAQLQLLRKPLQVAPEGGRHGRGYLHAGEAVSPAAWFFRAHFHQDPVMPGSLGVEAALQAMRAYGRWRYPDLARAKVRHPVNHTVAWRYRGQITPEDRSWAVGAHLSQVEATAEGVKLVGDVNLWKDRVRIYEVSDLAVKLVGS